MLSIQNFCSKIKKILNLMYNLNYENNLRSVKFKSRGFKE